MGRLCYPILPRPKRRGQAPGRVPFLQPESCHGARRVWRTFCRLGTNFIEHYACRGTSLIGATNLSPVTKLVAGTGPASGGTVQFVSEPEICQGAGFILRADARVRVQRPLRICLGCRSPASGGTKSVTNNLPILSVLGFRYLFSINMLSIYESI